MSGYCDFKNTIIKGKTYARKLYYLFNNCSQTMAWPIIRVCARMCWYICVDVNRKCHRTTISQPFDQCRLRTKYNGRLCFHMCLSVHKGEGGKGGLGYPANRTRYAPRDRTGVLPLCTDGTCTPPLTHQADRLCCGRYTS